MSGRRLTYGFDVNQVVIPLFRIKICGLTSVENATAVISAGADAIGLNFYAPSPRYIGVEVARGISDAVYGSAVRVGLFVNASLEDISETLAAVQLDAIQLHGDETPAFCQQVRRDTGLPLIRAFRCKDDSLANVEHYIGASAGSIDAALIDAYEPGLYGGAGKCVDWPMLAPHQGKIAGTPLILAGGLNPQNIARAIETAKPTAIDLASGVESSPGVKDLAKVTQLVSAARAVWADTT